MIPSLNVMSAQKSDTIGMVLCENLKAAIKPLYIYKNTFVSLKEGSEVVLNFKNIDLCCSY